MATHIARFAQLRWLHKIVSIISLVGALVLTAAGVLRFGSEGAAWILPAGVAWFCFTVIQMTAMPLLLKLESTVSRDFGELRDLHDTMTKLGASLSLIAENTRISDAAKSLAHRDQEILAVRTAIRDDLRQEKWDAAMKLVDDMEHRFGFREEAEVLREELDEARNEAIQARLSDAIVLIDGHFASHEWAKAESEIERLTHALPDDAKVQSLLGRLKAMRAQHKRELLEQWDEAVRRSDVDHAIDTLKALDEYLSPAEAESLHASARDVFKEKLLQLGVQFRFAVNEKRWQDSLNIGLELIREYPNARMAGEVREALDMLRERARHGGTAAETSAQPS